MPNPSLKATQSVTLSSPLARISPAFLGRVTVPIAPAVQQERLPLANSRSGNLFVDRFIAGFTAGAVKG